MPRYLLTPTKIPEIIFECMKRSALKDAVFTEDYPDKPVTVPTITWSILRRVPGKEGKETRKPRFRKRISTSKQEELRFGQWMTVIYQFDLFHTSNAEVNNLMDEFERFILEATPTLTSLGVETFIFDEQTKDNLIDAPEGSFVRTLRYYAVFTAIRSIYLPRVRDIRLVVNMDEISSTSAITRGTSDCDYLPETEIVNGQEVPLNITQLVGVADTEVLGASDYEANVDFCIVQDDNGKIKIIWLAGGKKPSVGGKYFVTYIKTESYFETSLLSTL